MASAYDKWSKESLIMNIESTKKAIEGTKAALKQKQNLPESYEFKAREVEAQELYLATLEKNLKAYGERLASK